MSSEYPTRPAAVHGRNCLRGAYTALWSPQVIAGSINVQGVMHVKVRRVGAETALSQIMKLVEEAQSNKAEVQRVADRISERAPRCRGRGWRMSE